MPRPTRPIGVDAPEDLSDLQDWLERPRPQRKAPPELGPDPPMPGDDREMMLDAVRNIARTIQLVSYRIRAVVEQDIGAVELPGEAAKSLRALQQTMQGLADAFSAVSELGQSGADHGLSDEDADLARKVLERAEQRKREAKPPPS